MTQQAALPHALTMSDLLSWPPTTDIETGGRAFGFGRTTAYALARANAFPCKVIRVGRSYRVVTADLLRVLRLTDSDGPGSSHPEPSDEHAPVPTSAN